MFFKSNTNKKKRRINTHPRKKWILEDFFWIAISVWIQYRRERGISRLRSVTLEKFLEFRDGRAIIIEYKVRCRNAKLIVGSLRQVKDK